ncbi:IclR family transcriptional regulator [Conexibacter stalactiti]|uniref:IclR family transcriptional regulator n=1 Tax=Conexibacter stalactiti TaxID=1940611 RepID=A0ABU4HLC3_9ACTN|nr:IclR family transcriptional regulator [Conexibacter stalactiti]MDW5594101.1 IclR family transcriptional regulator [Conexibacter stalactiti]MEC5034743.1 IclR family transcriptional regulator [Conexibacter stalactiti]
MQSAARAMRILLAISQSDNGLTTREISEALQLGRQAVYHLLHTLVSTGMLTRDDRNRYYLGLRVGTLAAGFERQLAPSEHLAPLVRALALETGETAYAAGWWSGEIMTLAVARGTSPVQAAEVPQGYVGDAHARASGKLLLAFAADATRDAYLDSHPLRAVQPNAVTSRPALERELDAIRARGHAVDDEEFAPGLCCMAVPFDGGRSPFVLALSAPSERFGRERERYLATMRRLVDLDATPDRLAVSAS